MIISFYGSHKQVPLRSAILARGSRLLLTLRMVLTFKPDRFIENNMKGATDHKGTTPTLGEEMRPMTCLYYMITLA